MRKTLFAAAALMLLPASAMAQEVPAETVEKIQAMLAGMQCEMDPANIETEDDGFELDDVFCADGQYDIDLDKDLNVVNKKKE